MIDEMCLKLNSFGHPLRKIKMDIRMDVKNSYTKTCLEQ